MNDENVDPQLEAARRSSIGAVLVVGAGAGVAMAILFVITMVSVVHDGTWDAAYVLMLVASLAGIWGAMHMLLYRQAYRILTSPRTKHVPTKGRISVPGLVVEGLAIAVIIFTSVYYLY